LATTSQLRDLSEVFVAFRGERPLSEQVYDTLRDAILAGRLAPGIKLPSTRALASALAVSRTTTQLAYDQLLAEGYLTARVGSGTFVARDCSDRPDASAAPSPATHAAPVARSDYAARLAAIRTRWRGVTRATDAEIRFRVGVPDSRLLSRKIWVRLIADAASDTSSTATEYGRTGGSPELRRAIAAYLEPARGVRCDPSQVVIVSGIQQGLGLVSRVLANPGDAALLEDPGYLGAASAFAAEGLRAVPVPIDDEGMDLDRVPEQALDGVRLAYVTPSHQFPTGSILSYPRRRALLHWAKSRGVFVFEDDYDSEFRFEGRPIESLYSLDDSGTVIYAGTFSKTIFPALRIGYLVLPPSLVESVAAAKWLAGFGNPSLEQRAVARFIEDGHYGRHVRRCRVQYARRRDRLLHELERRFGESIELGGQRAGLHVLVRFPDVPCTRVQDLVDAAAREGLEVQRADVFYATPPPEAALVLGYASLDEATIEEGVKRLARAVRDP
jgi:GntR family transcriptional regulator / MocR family aminotransferase